MLDIMDDFSFVLFFSVQYKCFQFEYFVKYFEYFQKLYDSGLRIQNSHQTEKRKLFEMKSQPRISICLHFLSVHLMPFCFHSLFLVFNQFHGKKKRISVISNIIIQNSQRFRTESVKVFPTISSIHGQTIYIYIFFIRSYFICHNTYG